MMVWISTLLCLGALGADVVPYEEIASSFEHDVARDSSTKDWREVVLDQCASLRLGAFDVRVPLRTFENRDDGEDILGILNSLVEAQAYWAGWIAGEKGPKRLPQVKVLGQWLRGLRSAGVRKSLRRSETADLLEALDASEKVRLAAKEFAHFMSGGDCVGTKRSGDDGVRLLLAPTREFFVGFACFVGLHDEEARSTVWTESIPFWTSFSWNGLVVLALRHPDQADAVRKDYRRGVSMNTREKTGLLQHVVHSALLRLMEYYFRDRLEPAIESGLVTDLVVTLFGEDNARVGGASGGNSTAMRSEFVRGGMSIGGRLPPINADSRWRRDKGRHFFVRVLRDNRKEAVRLLGSSKNDHQSFVLHGHGEKRLPIGAPFLGDSVKQEGLDAEFLGDSLEFFRAYSCAFSHWLRTAKAETNRGSSNQAFGALLRQYASQALGEEELWEDTASRLAEEVYGVPLSDADPGRDTLERRFLRWLSRR